MHEILQDYDNKIAAIDRRYNRALRFGFIVLLIYLATVIYFGFFY